MRWRVKHLMTGCYWSNDLGWVRRAITADTFTLHEREALRVPIDGIWERVPEKGDPPVRLFDVYVTSRRETRYTVEAVDGEDARAQVESSDNADREFGRKELEGEWSVQHVIEHEREKA